MLFPIVAHVRKKTAPLFGQNLPGEFGHRSADAFQPGH